MSDPVSDRPTPSPPDRLPAFWTTGSYQGGLLQGIGVGLLLAGVGTQAALLTAERFGPVAIVVGAVMIVLGGLKARSGR